MTRTGFPTCGGSAWLVMIGLVVSCPLLARGAPPASSDGAVAIEPDPSYPAPPAPSLPPIPVVPAAPKAAPVQPPPPSPPPSPAETATLPAMPAPPPERAPAPAPPPVAAAPDRLAATPPPVAGQRRRRFAGEYVVRRVGAAWRIRPQRGGPSTLGDVVLDVRMAPSLAQAARAGEVTLFVDGRWEGRSLVVTSLAGAAVSQVRRPWWRLF